MRVSIDGYAEATVVFAAAYPAPPPVDTAPLRDAHPAAVTAARMYVDRWMFHGPAYQGIVEMGRTLQLTVVTEGIEEAGEAALLRDFR